MNQDICPLRVTSSGGCHADQGQVCCEIKEICVNDTQRIESVNTCRAGVPEKLKFETDSSPDLNGRMKKSRRGEYNVEEASRNFELSDERCQKTIHGYACESCEMCTNPAETSGNSDKEISNSNQNSDASTSTDDETYDSSCGSRHRTGSYDFIQTEAELALKNAGADYADVSMEIAEEESEFDSDEECSSLSVSDSGDDDIGDPYGKKPRLVIDGQIECVTYRDEQINETQQGGEESSAKVQAVKNYSDCESEKEVTHEGSDKDSTVFDVQTVEQVTSDNTDPHGLFRKAAVRRKGFGWMKERLLKNKGNRLRHQNNGRNEDSSLELAPALISLYDHRVASETADEDNDDNKWAEATLKTKSLPDRMDPEKSTRLLGFTSSLPLDHSGSTINELMDTEEPGNIFPCNSDMRILQNKGDSSGDVMCCKLPSNMTLNNSDPSQTSIETELKRVAPGNIEIDRTNDRCIESESVTPYESGSVTDGIGSSPCRDYLIVPSSPSARSILSQLSTSTYRSDVPSFSSESSDVFGRQISATSDAQSPQLWSQYNQPLSSSLTESSGTLPELQGPSRRTCTEYESTADSPAIPRCSSGSSSRHEARMRFFTNYEEHMGQNQKHPNSVVDKNVCISSETRVATTNTIPSMTSPSALSATSGSLTVSQPHYNRPSQPTRKISSPDDRRDTFPHISRNKPSKRSDRRSSASKQEGISPLLRSGFSRISKKRDLLASSDSGNRSGVSYVTRVVTEIIESERTYIASLRDIIQGYLEPMEKILVSNEDKKNLDILFSNIREIYKFGCSFLANLEVAGTNSLQVAQCFVKQNKGFVIYTDYCTNYPRAVEVLTCFMQHPELSELCKERQTALGHGLPLGAYLLKPVQRILKYHLLLHNLVKNCEKEKGDVEILEQAFQHMTSMAHHINEMKRKHEHAVRIQEIQSQLEDYVGEDLTRLGDLVLEGTFRVYGAKASRQVFLFERGLLISKKQGGMLSCKAFILCSNLMLVEVIPNEPLSFHIIPFDNPRTQYTLQARNMEQKKRWCQDIKQLILESFKGRIPDNVKNLIMQLGREHDDDYVSKEALEAGRKNQHTAPEYLEKRKYRGKSGSRIPDFNLLKPNKAKRGGNKKVDMKREKKTAPELIQRAQSTSPDGHHQILQKQNIAKFKHQNSSPAISGSETSLPSMFQQIVSATDSAICLALNKIQKDAGYSQLPSESTSPESPIYRQPKFPHHKNRDEQTNLSENVGEGNKRTPSFVLARANPVLSDDITELLTRCGGSIRIQGPPFPIECEGTENVPSSVTDLQGFKSPSLINDADKKSLSINEHYSDDERMNRRKHGKYKNNAGNMTEDNNEPSSKSSAISEMEGYYHSDPKPKRQTEMEQSSANSSFDNIKVGKENVNDTFEQTTNMLTPENKEALAGVGNVYDKHIPNVRGRLRRDFQKSDQNLGKKDEADDVSGHKMEEFKKNTKGMTFHDPHSKGTVENVLKKKGLRLPNTSKHLQTQDYKGTGIRAKLTDWNSVEKLTEGSMNDLSHLDEDPWVLNSDVTSSVPKTDSERQNSSGSNITRPCGYSDTTEMMHISNDKENLDWNVYVNNHSQRPTEDQTLVHDKNGCISAHEVSSKEQEILDTTNNLSSEISYNMPGNGHSNFEDTNIQDNVKKCNDYAAKLQDHDTKNISSDFKSRMENAFGTSPVALRSSGKDTNSPLRPSSDTISDSDQVFSDEDLKERPGSLDAKSFGDESNQLVDEMKNYISNSSESVTNINRFPTVLPDMTVKGEDNSNRLSGVSSSSYESHDSSSSDGLIGTLKSKLHSWSMQSRSRNESEFSCASSTETSDDEETEAADSTKTGNTFESHPKNIDSWKEDRLLESVLRDHGLGSSKLGSRMAHSFTPLNEQNISHHCSDSSNHESPQHHACGFASLNRASEKSGKIPELNPLVEVQPRYPQADKIIDSQLSPKLKESEIETEKTTNNSFPHKNENLSKIGFELSADATSIDKLNEGKIKDSDENSQSIIESSNKKAVYKSSKKTTHERTNNKSTIENSYNKRKNSVESSESYDSYYERKFSAQFDSDVFQKKSDVVIPKDQTHDMMLHSKSIREYVQALEERFRVNSPKVFEVKRREPGIMIRERLQTLRESALHGWRNSGHVYNRLSSEENKISHRTHINIKQDYQGDPSVKIKPSCSSDSLSKSLESLSRSRDNVFMSKSRDSLNSLADSPGSRNSMPSFSFKTSNSGHEKDANRFQNIALEKSQTFSGNQFMHRVRSSSHQSMTEAEMQSSPDAVHGQMSKSMNRQGDRTSQTDSLVVMKGWVQSLISKFQVK